MANKETYKRLSFIYERDGSVNFILEGSNVFLFQHRDGCDSPELYLHTAGVWYQMTSKVTIKLAILYGKDISDCRKWV